MNDTEWYLIGGLIAAGVVILILLFLVFRRSSGAGPAAQSDAPRILGEDGQLTTHFVELHNETEENLKFVHNDLMNPATGLPYTDTTGVDSDSYTAMNPATGLPYTLLELEQGIYDES